MKYKSSLDNKIQHTLDSAFNLAREKHYQFFTVDHLTYALLDNDDALEVLAIYANIPKLREKLFAFIDETTPIIPFDDEKTETQPTAGLRRILQRALFRAQSAGIDKVNGAHILEAVFSESASKSVLFLEQAGVKVNDVRNYLEPVHLEQEKSLEKYSDIQVFGAEIPMGAIDLPGVQHSEVDKYLINLNEKVKTGKIEPLIARDKEILQVAQALSRRRKNNPLLIGEPGVGKTAIVEGLAKLIVEGKISKLLSKHTIYALDLASLLAGTRFRGDFEERLKGILEELKRHPNAVLFIDEIHTIIGAGATSGSTVDVANLIKPMLASGEIKCIGATTYQEYREVLEKDSALVRRFQKIDVAEPTKEQTLEILQGLKSRFEKHHSVKYTDGALRAAVELSDRFINDRFFPDKAIDVLDEAGASHMLLAADKQTGIIDEKAIEAVVAKMARIPEMNLSRSDKAMLRTLEQDLKQVVFGQDAAIETLVDVVKLARSGLREETKPIGSFLFAGPTGVGKTEIARQLSRLMGIELLRFDMSEYQEAHAVARLIGSPPGYVGYDKGGLLTEEVTKHPYSVVLLDEIEKAHPDIYNLLLQVMDYGVMTDSSGRKADFRHVALIMTTNAGAALISRSSIGFTTQDYEHSDSLEEIKRVFSPEFRNRLDAIVQFNPLDLTTITNVVNKFIEELTLQLEKKSVALSVNEDAKLWLAEHGHDKEMGARPMSRLLQEKLKKPLANELLFGRLSEGGFVTVGVEDGQLKIDFE